MPTIEAVPVKLDGAKTDDNTTSAATAEEGTTAGGEPQSVTSGCGESAAGESETVKTEKAGSTEQPATVKSAVSTSTESK